MSYTNGTQTQSQSMNGLLEITTDNISADTITTATLTATDATIDTLTVANTINGNLNGTATNATNISTTQDNANTGYLSWIKYTGLTSQPSYFSSSLFYDAGQNKISADLQGTASSATYATSSGSSTNATNASKIGVGTTTTDANFFLTFVNNITGNLFPYVSSDLVYNPIGKMLTSPYITTIENTVYNYIFNYGSENATDLTTGALQVPNGGASIGQDLYLGGSASIGGNASVTGTTTSYNLTVNNNTTVANISSPFFNTSAYGNTPYSPSASLGNNIIGLNGSGSAVTLSATKLNPSSSQNPCYGQCWSFTTPTGYVGGTFTISIPISTTVSGTVAGGAGGYVNVATNVASVQLKIYKNSVLWATVTPTVVSGGVTASSFKLTNTTGSQQTLTECSMFLCYYTYTFTPTVNAGDVYSIRLTTTFNFVTNLLNTDTATGWNLNAQLKFNTTITASSIFTPAVVGNLTGTGITVGSSTFPTAVTGVYNAPAFPANNTTGVITENFISYSALGTDNTFNTTAISSPIFKNGISRGTGDGASYTTFNNAINSWYGTGFVNTETTAGLTCNAVINHRNGDFSSKGSIYLTGSITCNTVISEFINCPLFINGDPQSTLNGIYPIRRSIASFDLTSSPVTLVAQSGTLQGTYAGFNYNGVLDRVFLPPKWGVIAYSAVNYGTVILNVKNNGTIGIWLNPTSFNAIRSARIYYNDVEQT